MRFIGPDQIHAALAYPALIAALEEMFRAGCTPPLRHHHTIPVPGGAAGTLLLMPAWREGRYAGVKLVSVFPGNAGAGLPSVMGLYVLLDARTGQPLATLDGAALTLRRTVAASALAARFLAREDARHLLIVGTGALAHHLAQAHASVRPIAQVTVWGRARGKAKQLAAAIARTGLAARTARELAAAAAEADIISCATMTKDPLVRGEWLRPGTHLDLIGGFTPAMREADDEAVRRARVFVDTYAGALAEAGDIVQPIAGGVLTREAIGGDLYELTQGARPGRQGAAEITLFKSVGSAIEDLAAAELAWRLCGDR